MKKKAKKCPSSAFMEDSFHKSASTIDKQHQGHVRRFEQTCSLDPRPRRKKTPAPRVQEAKSTIKEVICQKPNTTIRELARDTQISPAFVRSVMLNNLELYPYKFPIYQRLLASDYKKRVDFARWYFTKPWTIVNKMIFSDEAYFPYMQPLNRQNNRIWAKEKPSEYPLYDQKVSVFCAISSTKIYGSYFFFEQGKSIQLPRYAS